MKRSTLVLIIVAATLTVAGLTLMGVSFATGGFNVRNISLGGEYKVAPNEHPVWGEFENIEITSSLQDVFILPSADDSAYVVADETQKMYTTVEIVGDTLKIKYVDARMWFEMVGIQTDDVKLTLYLPKGAYNSLKITTASGDITVPDGYTFSDMSLSVASGSVKLSGIDAPTAALSVNSASGDVELGGCALGLLKINTASGEVDIKSCTVGSLDIDTASGDIELEMLDAGFVNIDTASGEVDARLKSDMAYFVKTVSGNVRTPVSVSGAAECHISTASGDVTVSVIGK